MYLKENELRIGNLALGNNDDIVTITADIFKGNMYQYLYGIELTPSWLLSSGFEIVKEGEFLSEPVGDNQHRIRIWTNGIFFFYSQNKFIANEIRYLHTLQNLFFCLTGEELEIKQLETIKL